MEISQNKSNSIAILRQKAENFLKKSASNPDSSFPTYETLELLYELEVHQLELEMQNEELIQAQTLAQNAVDLYNYAPNGYFTLSPSAEIIDLNNTAADLLKKEKSELIGSLFSIFVTAETKPILTIFLQKVLCDKNRESCEITLALSENIEMFVQLTGVVSKKGDQCLVTIIDITEKKQAEAIIQQEREFYKDLVNNQPAGIYRVRVFSKEKWLTNAWGSSKNAPYKMEMVSDRFCEILGITHSEFEANTAIITDLIHPQDKQEFILKNEEANTKISSFEWECRLIIHDKMKWVHFESFPRPLKNGDILWTGIIYDISEKKQAELTLKESDERFQLLFDKAPLGYQSLDINGNFIEVNQQWLDTLGYQREEVIGKWFGDFMPPYYQELVKVNFPKFKEQGHIHSEFELIHKNGDILFIAFDGKIGYELNGDFKQTHCILQDVTEQRKLEFELKKSEEKFRNYFENSIVGMSLTSIDGKLIVNKAFCDIVGYSEDELKQLKWNEITHEDDVELNENILKAILNGEKDSARWEKRYIHKNGTIVWVDISTSLQRDEAGNPLFFITSINDITDRKRTEKELNESREQFKDLFENAPVAYHEIDAEGKIVRMNKTELDMLGYTADEVVGKLFWELAPDRTVSKQSISAKLKGDALSDVPFEREFSRKDGTKIPVLIQDVMLWDSDGNILGIRSTVQNITEQKKSEMALRNSEEKFKKAFMTSPDSININRMEDGMYISINSGFTRIMGYTEEDILGKTAFDKNIWYNHSDRNRVVEGLKTTGMVENLVAQFRKKSGELVFGMMSATIIELDGINYILSITRDITEIKKVENALRESEERFKVLFEKAPDAMFLADRDTRKIVDANIAASRLFKKEKNELIGIYQHELHPEKVSSKSVEDFELHSTQSLNTDVTIPIENTIITSEGNEISVEILGQAIKIGENDLLLGTFRDITERKKAEATLKNSQKLLSETEKIGNVGGWEYYYDSGKLNWTEETYNIHELSYEENLTLDVGVNFYTPESLPIIESAVQQAINFGVPFDLELEIITQKGNVRNVHTIGKIDSDHYRIYGFFQDITERKIAEDQISIQLQELRRWYDVTLDREGRVLELKREVNELLKEHGEVLRYESAEQDNSDIH